MVDVPKVTQFVGEAWDSTIVPTLSKYIEIPNQSPSFDAEYHTNGLVDKAVDLLVDWVKAQKVEGLTLEVVRVEKRTPIIFMEVPATKKEKVSTVFLYGHMDKQPPMAEAWEEGLGPYKPVIRDGKLYGRGGADDGYSTFAAITAIQALKKFNIPHDRYVVLIESCEESGSVDLPFYIEHLKEKIATPALIVCLDSGCGNYDQFWMTTSLRGMLAGTLRVDILKEGVHSGHASGIVPSSFDVVRQLLDRIEDSATGRVKVQELHVDIPKLRREQAQYCASVLGDSIHHEFPFVAGAKPTTHDLTDLLIRRSWEPSLSVTGAEGLPALQNAGNVQLPYTALKLSIRLPPTKNGPQAGEDVKKVLEKDPPFGAKVSFTPDKNGAGWESPALTGWLEKACSDASTAFFGKPHCNSGEGGSIPFMGMLGAKFPKAQFIITGLLGPGSNAHGPNEFLHIDFAKKLTGCVVHLLEQQASLGYQG